MASGQQANHNWPQSSLGSSAGMSVISLLEVANMGHNATLLTGGGDNCSATFTNNIDKALAKESYTLTWTAL